jgi:hypothetical protein
MSRLIKRKGVFKLEKPTDKPVENHVSPADGHAGGRIDSPYGGILMRDPSYDPYDKVLGIERRDPPYGPFRPPNEGDGRIYAFDTAVKSDKASDVSEQDELVGEYIDDLKANSEYPETIAYDGEPFERVSPEENAKKREEFENSDPDNEHSKEALIKKWEEKNGKEWPRYTEDLVDGKTGRVIRTAGSRYDAHHIRPLCFGGKNEASNITPISAEKHYDHRGVHAPDSPYGKLVELSKGE